METQSPITESISPSKSSDPSSEFPVGDSVIYAMHGRCAVSGVETRTLGEKTIRFYKLEIQRSTPSRTARQEPAIWVPVASARDQGLRRPILAAEIEPILNILSSREYYLDPNSSWNAQQTKIEETIRKEGAFGLAKTISFLHVMKRKQVVPTPEVNKMYETTSKLLIREISEITGETIRALEEKIVKLMRHKLLPDN